MDYNDGVITLMDHSRWMIMPSDLPLAASWLEEDEIEVQDPKSRAGLYTLINLSRGNSVLAEEV